MNYTNVLGLRIAQLRKENGLTQKQLADKLKVDNTTISSWELGKNDVPTAILVELAKLFDTTTDYLLGLTE
ncbi:MAG: helix-turn-helix transcriptional regulator [Clostridiales bacterium]|nr:helix-turn-helix transcriptional regulator [Clostridiales bacterium]